MEDEKVVSVPERKVYDLELWQWNDEDLDSEFISATREGWDDEGVYKRHIKRIRNTSRSISNLVRENREIEKRIVSNDKVEV